MSGESEQPDGDSAAALRLGRAAHARRAWGEAFRELSRAEQLAPLGTEDLELLAWSAGLSGRTEQLLQLLERLHRLHLEQGNRLRAARVAFWLGFRLQSLEEHGRGSGWVARSEALVAEHDGPCVEAGYLQLPLVRACLVRGDVEGALRATAQATATGERFGEADLLGLARSLEGRVRLGVGQVRDG